MHVSAASATVTHWWRAGWWPENEDENQEGGRRQALSWAWAMQTCPQVKKNESTDGLHPLRFSAP